MTVSPPRTRRDRCPGVLRPWAAEDGALVRVRLAGGHLPAAALASLSAVARRYGDGELHLTGRANLQLRALPWDGDRLPDAVLSAVERTGLLPSRSHELARNLMCSPQTGLAQTGLAGTGPARGRADLRPVVRELDARICADPALAELPGRFLFVLDDGRGDLVDRDADLGAVVLDAGTVQLRIGSDLGPVLPLGRAAEALTALAGRFVRERGDGPTAAWHVAELLEAGTRLVDAEPADPRLPEASEPPAHGAIEGAEHVPVPDGVLTPGLVDVLVEGLVEGLVDGGHDLVVTPWRSVLVTAR